MKHLRIELGKGQYALDGVSWKDVDQLTRDDLLALVDLALSAELEMDLFDVASLPNPAHQIVYSQLSARLAELIENRDRFRDDSGALFKEAFEKYSLPDDEPA